MNLFSLSYILSYLLLVLSYNVTVSESYFASNICAQDLCNNLTSSCVYVGAFPAFFTSQGPFLFPSSLSTKLEPDPYGSPTPSCDGDPSCNSFCRSSACSGSSEYCANHNCTSQSSCYCDIGLATTNSYIDTSVGNLKVDNQSMINLYWCSIPSGSKKRSISLDASANCTLYTIDNYPTLNLKSIPDITGFIKATFNGETKIIQYSQGASLSIPDAWTHKTGTILFEVVSSTAYCTSSYSMVARTTCTVTDCILCSDFWSNWQCIPSTYRTAMVWFAVILILFIICMLPWLGWVLYVAFSLIVTLLCYLFKFSRSLRKTKVAKKVYDKWNSHTNTVRDMFQTEESSSDDNDIESEPVNLPVSQQNQTAPKRKIRAFRNGIALYSILCICCLIYIPTVDACNGGLSVSSTSNLCTSNGTSQRCTTSFDLVGSVASISDKFCFTLNSPTGDIWTGFVQHIGSVATVSLNSLYYTSPWSGVSQSAHWCDGTSKCSGGCSGVCSTRNCNGALSNSQLSLYPGISQCHSSCGCVTCSNCFLCTPSCLYSGFAIVPSGPVYQVFSPGTIVFEPSVWVNIQGPGVNINRAVTLSQNSISVGNFTVKLNGAFQGNQISFNGNSLLCDTTSPACYLTPVAQLNQLTSGVPGDIQAPTLSALTTPNQNFRIGTIYSVVQGDLGDTYIFQSSGVVSTAPTWMQLPAAIDGNIFTGNSTFLKTNVTSPPPILFSMTTPSGLTYTRNQNIVCPTFVITNASGCYSCQSGSVVTITARSTCSSGTVSVTSDIQLVTTSLSLSTSNTIYMIYVKPTRSPTTFSLTLSSPLASATQTFTFSPVFVSNVVNQTYNVNNGTSQTTEDFNSVNSFFSGLAEDISEFSKTTEGIVTWVLISVVVVGALILSIMIPKYKTKTK